MRAPRPAATGRRLGLTALTVAVGALCTLPLVVVAVTAFDLGPAATWDLLWRPRVGELLGNTLALVALTVSACVVIGVFGAWAVERTQLPGAGIWRVLLVCPLAVPAFVNSYSWVGLVPSLQGLWGAALVTTLSYFPFVFLPVAAVLRALDRSIEEGARSLGLSPWRAFARAVVPQLRPAVVGGALLVALHLLSEFGVLAMLRYPTFTTAILEQFQVAFSTSAGSVLALVLIVVCLSFLGLDWLIRGRLRHARVGRGTTKPIPRIPLRTWSVPVVGLLGTLVVAALGVPLMSITRWLIEGRGSVDLGPWARSLGATVGFGLVAGLVTVMLALPVAWAATRRRSALGALVERLTYIASSLPGVVVALALVTLTVRYASGIYQTAVVLVAAYVILFIPRAVVTIRASLAHVRGELLEAARALGDSPWGAVRRVLLPLTLPGIAAGFALVFIAVGTELTATLLLAPTGTRTLATGFWSASESLDYVGAAPYAATMVVVSAPVISLLLRRSEPEEV